MAFRVLDSSAFYAGIPFSSNEPSYITSLVYDEIEHIKKVFTVAVIDAAKKTGDFSSLSREDISTIALSLQLKAELVTDDFAVSNVAKNLKLKVIPIMTSGIKNIITWTYYCPGCETNFSKVTECPNCGNRLKRRPLKINQES